MGAEHLVDLYRLQRPLPCNSHDKPTAPFFERVPVRTLSWHIVIQARKRTSRWRCITNKDGSRTFGFPLFHGCLLSIIPFRSLGLCCRSSAHFLSYLYPIHLDILQFTYVPSRAPCGHAPASSLHSHPLCCSVRHVSSMDTMLLHLLALTYRNSEFTLPLHAILLTYGAPCVWPSKGRWMFRPHLSYIDDSSYVVITSVSFLNERLCKSISSSIFSRVAQDAYRIHAGGIRLKSVGRVHACPSCERLCSLDMM